LGVNAFRMHSGACDVILVRHRDQVSSTSWHCKVANGLVGSGAEAKVQLKVGNIFTDVIMKVGDDCKCYFEDHPEVCHPPAEQLHALPIKLGCNPSELVVLQRDQATGDWKEVASIPLGLFLWERDDKIVIADVEGTVIKGDIWTKSADLVLLTTNKHTKGAGGLETVRDGVGPLLSYLDRAGYRVLFLTAAPITRADRVRQTINWIREAEVEQWGKGAHLPASPILTTQERMGTVLLQKLSDRTLAPFMSLSKDAGGNHQSSFKTMSLAELSEVFRGPGEEEDAPGTFVGGFCEKVEDAAAYENAGIPQDKIFLLDRAGRVRCHSPELSEYVWASYVEMYPQLSEVFPKVNRNRRKNEQVM